MYIFLISGQWKEVIYVVIRALRIVLGIRLQRSSPTRTRLNTPLAVKTCFIFQGTIFLGFPQSVWMRIFPKINELTVWPMWTTHTLNRQSATGDWRGCQNNVTAREFHWLPDNWDTEKFLFKCYNEVILSESFKLQLFVAVHNNIWEISCTWELPWTRRRMEQHSTNVNQ